MWLRENVDDKIRDVIRMLGILGFYKVGKGFCFYWS